LAKVRLHQSGSATAEWRADDVERTAFFLQNIGNALQGPAPTGQQLGGAVGPGQVRAQGVQQLQLLV